MSAQILDGKATAAAIRTELSERVAVLREQDVVPGLATILIGDDPGSHTYVRNKHRASEEVGIQGMRYDLPASTKREQVLDLLAELNSNPEVDGYILQFPVPDHLDFNELLLAIDPAKDADGLHPVNLGLLALGVRNAPRPCTPVGIVELLRRHDVQIAGQHVVIVGRGTTVGRPLAMLLSLKEEFGNATVTQCHTGTKDLASFTRQADILVAAVGQTHMITPDMVKGGAAVVDVGISRGADGIAGDVAPEVAEVAGWLSPVPGGVGPMTIAMLLSNAVSAAERRASASLG